MAGEVTITEDGGIGVVGVENVDAAQIHGERSQPVQVEIVLHSKVGFELGLDEYDELSDVLYGRSSFYDRYTSDNRKKYERIMSTARKAWKAVLLTYGMDMDNSYRNEHYTPNVKTLRSICEQLRIDTLSDEDREEKK